MCIVHTTLIAAITSCYYFYAFREQTDVQNVQKSNRGKNVFCAWSSVAQVFKFFYFYSAIKNKLFCVILLVVFRCFFFVFSFFSVVKYVRFEKFSENGFKTISNKTQKWIVIPFSAFFNTMHTGYTLHRIAARNTLTIAHTSKLRVILFCCFQRTLQNNGNFFMLVQFEKKNSIEIAMKRTVVKCQLKCLSIPYSLLKWQL